MMKRILVLLLLVSELAIAETKVLDSSYFISYQKVEIVSINDAILEFQETSQAEAFSRGSAGLASLSAMTNHNLNDVWGAFWAGGIIGILLNSENRVDVYEVEAKASNGMVYKFTTPKLFPFEITDKIILVNGRVTTMLIDKEEYTDSDIQRIWNRTLIFADDSVTARNFKLKCKKRNSKYRKKQSTRHLVEECPEKEVEFSIRAFNDFVKG